VPTLCYVPANNDFEPCSSAGINNGASGVFFHDLALTAMPSHDLLLGQASSPITGLAPGSVGLPLVSQGASADPAYAQCSVAGGCTGAGSFTAHNLLIGEGTNAFNSVGGVTGQILASTSAADPAFTAQPTLGANGVQGGKLTMAGVVNGSASIKVADTAGTPVDLVLPVNNGSANNCMQTDGAGNLFWGGCTSAGSLSVLNNNSSIQWKDNPGGTARSILNFDTANLLQLGSGSGTNGIVAKNTFTLAPGINLQMQGTAAGLINFQTQNSSGSYNFNLPTGSGTVGQPLLSGGGGSAPMTFGTLGMNGGGLGATSETQNGFLVGQGTNPVSTLSCNQGTTIQGNAGAPTCTFGLSLGANASTGGSLILNGSTSGSATVKVASVAGTATIFQLPNSNGTSGYILQTDGAGNTSWTPPGNFTGSLSGNNQYSSSGGTAPTLGGGCGTSPTLLPGATDNAGFVTMGTGTVTTCTINFANVAGVPTNNPVCTLNDQGSFQPLKAIGSPTGLQIIAQTNMGTDTVAYLCTFKG